MKAIPIKDIGRNEWLELRKKGIGGSDAAAILGLNPYSSAFQVYCDKLGLIQEQPDNEAMRQGRDFEQYVAERFYEAAGKKVKRCNFMFQSDEHPFMFANVDRLVVGEKAGLECKTTSILNRSDFSIGDVPPSYYCQCQHYMAVTGFPVWYLAVLVLNKGFYWFEIKRNDSDIDALITAERLFWTDNVLAQKEPAPDGSERAGDVIKQLYGNNGDDAEVTQLIGFDADLERYNVVSELIKGLEKEKKEITQKIQCDMKSATVGFAGKYTVYWKGYHRATVDTKRLKSERPDIYEEYCKTSDFRKFEVKGV